MGVVLRVVIAGAGGALGGALAGFATAILSLQARRWRNRRLMQRDESPIRDESLPVVFIYLCALVGLLVAAPLGAFWPAGRAILVGALVPAGLLALLQLVVAASQSFER